MNARRASAALFVAAGLALAVAVFAGLLGDTWQPALWCLAAAAALVAAGVAVVFMAPATGRARTEGRHRNDKEVT